MRAYGLKRLRDLGLRPDIGVQPTGYVRGHPVFDQSDCVIAQAPTHGAAPDPHDLLTRSELRAWGLKPAPDQQPMCYQSPSPDHPGQQALFLVMDCCDIDPALKTPRCHARQRLIEIGRGLRSYAAAASRTAQSWLADACVVLDTETTDGGPKVEVLELAILDGQGRTLFNQRIRPVQNSAWPGAQRIHGISPADLGDAPTWDMVHDEVAYHVAGRTVVMFNKPFDQRMMAQSAAVFGLELPAYTPVCAMVLAALFLDPANPTGRVSLKNAAAACDVLWHGAAHGAYADTRATVDVVRAIARYTDDLELERLSLLRSSALSI